MMRAVGAALVILGSSGAGVAAFRAAAARVRTLSSYAAMLGVLRREIYPELATLEEALSAAIRADAAPDFARSVLRGMRSRGGADASECWLEACSAAPQEIRGILAELAPLLGRCSAEEQSRALEKAELRIERLRDAAEDERRRSGRMYITFGICGGAAAAVMLL